MHTAASWVIGFVVFIALGLAFSIAGDAMGVPSSIDLDEPTTVTHGSGRYSYDEEVTSFQTSYGYATMGLSLLAALWAGQAFHACRWSANFSQKGRYAFAAWLIALSILAAISILVHLVFREFHGTSAYYAPCFSNLEHFAVLDGSVISGTAAAHFICRAMLPNSSIERTVASKPASAAHVER